MNPFIKEAFKNIQQKKPITIWIDIDGTLCDTSKKGYATATPIEAMIHIVNWLYEQGHTIILVTARGATSNIDWFALTNLQLKEWGVKYHKLLMGRPKNLYIGDEALQPEEFICDMMDVIE